MGCNDSNTPAPPAAELMIDGETADPRIVKAVNDATAALKQAGVSRVRIMDFESMGGPIEIRPMSGNRDGVNAALDAIKNELQEAGLKDVREAPAFRCANSPNELQIRHKSAGQGR